MGKVESIRVVVEVSGVAVARLREAMGRSYPLVEEIRRWEGFVMDSIRDQVLGAVTPSTPTENCGACPQCGHPMRPVCSNPRVHS